MGNQHQSKFWNQKSKIFKILIVFQKACRSDSHCCILLIIFENNIIYQNWYKSTESFTNRHIHLSSIQCYFISIRKSTAYLLNDFLCLFGKTLQFQIPFNYLNLTTRHHKSNLVIKLILEVWTRAACAYFFSRFIESREMYTGVHYIFAFLLNKQIKVLWNSPMNECIWIVN